MKIVVIINLKIVKIINNVKNRMNKKSILVLGVINCLVILLIVCL